MDLEVASHCVGPLTREYLSKLPHHVLPCTNLKKLYPFEENQDVVPEYFLKKIPWRSSVPAPLIPLASTTFEALNGIDPTTVLIRDKVRWQMKKEKILNAVKKDKKNISEKTMRRAEVAEADTYTEVPRGVALLAQHLDKDPDPQFAGVYNWYYTGGTLATLTNKEENYLLHASHSKLSCSRHIEDEYKSELLFTLALEVNTPVYQIATSAVGAVVARQKSCVSLFAIGESDGKLCLDKIHSVLDKRDPFLGVALRDQSNKKYCTLSSNGILKLWDVEYTKSYKMKMRVTPGEGVMVMDSWSSIQFVDNSTLLLADRCCIHLLDYRMDMKEKQVAWCPRKLGEQCEQLSYVTTSRQQDQVYTMTTHQALTLDLRIGFVQRWSHMMSAPPYVGFTHAVDNDHEFLCIGSQVMSDCVVLANRWRGEDPEAEYSPVVLPSPSQGLLQARQQGLCLEPTLSQRFSQSLIGLTCLPSANGLHIVRQSATGDVFIQQLSSADNAESSDQLTDKQLTAYSDWGSPAMSLQRETTTVNVTDVKDFTPILEVLIETLPPEEPSKSNEEVSGGWRRSKQYLEDCVDLLAPKLFSVWEVEDEEEWQQQQEEMLVVQDPAEKVHNWLQAGSNITFNDQTLTDMPSSLKPRVTSTPYVMPSVEVESPSKSVEEPSPWMANPGQKLPQTPSRPQAHLVLDYHSPPLSIHSSDSDKPPLKRQRLFEDTITTPAPRQLVPAAKKPPTSTAKKKFIPGF